MNLTYLIIRDRKFVEVPMITWACWIADIENRRIAFTSVAGVDVFTTYVGCPDMGYLFETMAFRCGGSEIVAQERCSGAVDQAEEMHARVVARFSDRDSIDSAGSGSAPNDPK